MTNHEEYQNLMFRPSQEEETRLCRLPCVAYKFIHDPTILRWPSGGWYHSNDCPVKRLWPRTDLETDPYDD